MAEADVAVVEAASGGPPGRPGEASRPEDGAGLSAWLVAEALKACREPGERGATDRLVHALCRRLVEHGMRLHRVVLGVRAMHPQLYGRQTIWQRGCDCVTTIDREFGIESSPIYLDSPVRRVRADGAPLRRRLIGPEARLDFPVLGELRAEGATDYFITPLGPGGEHAGYLSFTTDQPGGFRDADLALIEAIVPVLALAVELFAARRMADDLLAVYLGRDAARRVIDGEIRRGTGQLIRAVLWHCDLKGFTALSDVTPPAELIALLDGYFEAMARPVEEQGGEVLKFIGDGILAIFRIDPDNEAGAVGRALEATGAGLANLAALNQARRAAGRKPLASKIALHLGEMMYGNVGAANRLDFTVIGPAVNTVARVQALCGPLEEPVLATAEVARLAPGRMASRGAHHLRGLAQPTELYGLDPRPRAA